MPAHGSNIQLCFNSFYTGCLCQYPADLDKIEIQSIDKFVKNLHNYIKYSNILDFKHASAFNKSTSLFLLIYLHNVVLIQVVILRGCSVYLINIIK